MKKYILITIVLLLAMQLQAQSIERQVVGSGGMTLSTDLVTLDFTVGETVVTTIANDNSILTQGFHQTPFSQVIVIDPEPTAVFSLYPNPTSGRVIIEGEGIKETNIYAITGQRVFRTNKTSFDISHLLAGVYIAQIETKSKLITKRIVKE